MWFIFVSFVVGEKHDPDVPDMFHEFPSERFWKSSEDKWSCSRNVIMVWMSYDLWEQVSSDSLELTMTAVWVLRISTLHILLKSRPETETERESVSSRRREKEDKRVTIILLWASPWMIPIISCAVSSLLLPLQATVKGNNMLQFDWGSSVWHTRTPPLYHDWQPWFSSHKMWNERKCKGTDFIHMQEFKIM